MFSFSSLTGSMVNKKKEHSSKEASTSTDHASSSHYGGGDSHDPHGYGGMSSQHSHHEEFRAKRSRGGRSSSHNEHDASRQSRENMDPRKVRLTEEEYELIARDIMSKPPFSGYLKYHLPLKYAARTEEVKWEWIEEGTGMLVHRELIGGGKNSDLDY